MTVLKNFFEFLSSYTVVIQLRHYQPFQMLYMTYLNFVLYPEISPQFRNISRQCTYQENRQWGPEEAAITKLQCQEECFCRVLESAGESRGRTMACSPAISHHLSVH